MQHFQQNSVSYQSNFVHHQHNQQQQQQRHRLSLLNSAQPEQGAPRIVCEGLQPLCAESLEQRSLRRKRILNAILQRDAPELLDPNVIPGPYSSDDDADDPDEPSVKAVKSEMIESGVRFDLYDSPSDVEMKEEEMNPSQNAEEPMDVTILTKVKREKKPLKYSDNVIDANVVAFPEKVDLKTIQRLNDFKHNGPSFVNIRDLVTPRRRPISYHEVFRNVDPLSPSLEPFSHKIDTTPIDFVADVYRQSNYVSSPLFTRQPLGQRYLRAVSRAFRDEVYCYKTLPTLDPMYNESDYNMPILERVLMRDREVRMQREKPSLAPISNMPPNPTISHAPPPILPMMQQQLPAVMASGSVVVKMKESVDSGTATPNSADSGSTGPTVETPVPPPSTEKKYVCTASGCTKAYKNLQGLKNHVNKTHPGMPVPSRTSHSEESTPIPSNRPTSKASSVLSRAPTPLNAPTPMQSIQQHIQNYASPVPLQSQQTKLPAPPPQAAFKPATPQMRQTERNPSISSSTSTPMEVDTVTIVEPPVPPQLPTEQRPLQTTPVATPAVSQAPTTTPATSTPPTKLKCSFCSRGYKTVQNISRHMREVHQHIYDPAGQHQQLPPHAVPQTFYTTQQGQVLVEQSDGDVGGRTSGQPVTIMRQLPHHTSQMVTLDHQGQPGQMMQVHYQVQSMQPRQQAIEVERQGFSQHSQSNQNNDDVMVVEDSPPRTPARSSDSQTGQPVLLQTSTGQLVRQTPASGQIIREVTTAQGHRQVQFMPQQVHIIQQGSGQSQVVSVPQGTRGEPFTVLVRQQSGLRPMTGQLARNGSQVITSQPTFVYQQHPASQASSSGTRFIINTPPTSRSANTGRNTPATASASQNSDDTNNDYYSSPPQLTPQQPQPPRAQISGRSGAQVYSRRVPAGSSTVRITQAPMQPGVLQVQKSNQVRYAIQMSGNGGQGGSGGGNTTYVQSNAIPGNVQYVRTANGSQLPTAGVRFITTTNPNLVRVQGQRPVQQYAPASNQQRGYAPRPTRMRIAVPVVAGQQQVRRARPQTPQQSQIIQQIPVAVPPQQHHQSQPQTMPAESAPVPPQTQTQ